MDEFHTFEEAATTFVNPLTIMAMYDTCKQYKVNAVINTAASS